MQFLRGNAIFKRPLVKMRCKIMVFVSYFPKSFPKSLFEPSKNQHPILNPCAKFELNWLRTTKVTEKPHFRWNEWAETRNDVIFRQCL